MFFLVTQLEPRAARPARPGDRIPSRLAFRVARKQVSRVLPQYFSQRHHLLQRGVLAAGHELGNGVLLHALLRREDNVDPRGKGLVVQTRGYDCNFQVMSLHKTYV